MNRDDAVKKYLSHGGKVTKVAKPFYREEIRREKKRAAKDAAMDRLMAQIKVGADPTGILTLRRNQAVRDFRGEHFFHPEVLAKMRLPRPKEPPPTRGHKRQTGHGYHTPAELGRSWARARGQMLSKRYKSKILADFWLRSLPEKAVPV
jgi:hypothetical protein